MHESRIENGMLGDGDGLPEAICKVCGVDADYCECDYDEDYQRWREEEEDGKG